VKPKWIWMGISSIVFLVGLVLIFFGLRDILLSQRSTNWQPTAGVIVSSDLGVEDDGDGNTLYSAKIQYTYTLEGQQLQGDRVFFGAMSTSERQQVFDLLLKYPIGTAVTVYYDPADPSQAVLEPGIHGANWFLPILGAAFGLVGLAFIVIGFFVHF
jgi:hypothetical protein